MKTKPRSPGNTAISVSIDAGTLREIDRRSSALGLSRSAYLRALALQDCDSAGSISIAEKATPKGPRK
jgi:hypothetical protein